MHHLYPASKGDQLCPLGFHPQVRWPTRCKRCFRDYKEHIGRRGDEVTASSPSLSESNIRSRDPNSNGDKSNGRSWTSTSNLSTFNTDTVIQARAKRPSSWTSTPDLDDNEKKPDVEVKLLLPPRRRHTTTLDMSQVEETFIVRRPPIPPQTQEAPEDLTILRTDTLAERVRKMQMIKKQNSVEREFRSLEKDPSSLPSPSIRKRVENRKSMERSSQRDNKNDSSSDSAKSSSQNLSEIECLRRELELARGRAERAEIEKSDIMLRKLSSMNTVSNKTAASEALKLQQKINEMNKHLEEEKDEKNKLSARIKELERRSSKSIEEDLKKKLQAAEQLCEELMDENSDMKKELSNMEREFDEIQDNFRDDQADEYSKIKKELEVTNKNCRILSFKLKKSERKIEQLEQEKQSSTPTVSQLKKLEEELRISNEVIRQLQAEAEKSLQGQAKTKTPLLGTLGKSSSADGKYSRSSLTRGGSQEDPVQLMRDLQDSMERESDVREQLKFAEEEAESLRKKAQRIEDENESLMMQLKKMASKARNRKLSPTAPPNRITVDDKDEGISDEEDPAELRVLLDLNEQEASQLRRKVEELESTNESSKKQVKELQEKIRTQPTAIKDNRPIAAKTLSSSENLEKLRNKDKEISEMKMKLNEKERAIEKLSLELKNSSKTTALNGGEQQQIISCKRQLESVEREASVLRGKVQTLEKEIEILTNDNKKMAVRIGRYEKDNKSGKSELDKLNEQLLSANAEISKQKESITAQAQKIADFEKQTKENVEKSKKLQTKVKELEEKLVKTTILTKQLETDKALFEKQLKQEKENVKKLQIELDKEKKESGKWESKVSDLDTDLSALRKKTQKDQTALEKEIERLKANKLEVPSKKLDELKKQNLELQTQLENETKKLAETTAKFEQLEESYVFTRAQLSTEKENLENNFNATKTKLSTLEVENAQLRKDNIDLSRKIVDTQNKLKDMDAKQAHNGAVEHERTRLLAALKEKDQEYEFLVKENEMNKDLGIQLKRENDELRKKFSDFEKVNKVQSAMNANTTSLEQELKKLKAKLDSTEMTAKSDVAATRLRYEQQVNNLQNELNALQKQCERFKWDRDSYKNLLENAQKSIKELKNNSGRASRGSVNSGDEDDKSRILLLEEQLGSLEDELCESRYETSKLKTELVSEKTVSEIKISELQSRLNEYEEERLLGSGRSKMPGIKTKLELSWQKEREDQQRLLQETSKLARDLRQTLFELERERDKERLESRRKLDQFKKANDEEIDEGRKKISELQCDLLELRDAHAKLRTSNEKLRRERERYEREKDYILGKRAELTGDNKIKSLLQTIDEIIKVAPDIVPNSIMKKAPSPSPPLPRLAKQRSSERNRSPSPSVNVIQISTLLARLAETSEEVRRFQRQCDDEREREKSRRYGMRRAQSTETDTPDMQRPPTQRLSKSQTHNGSLYRKSLSFDQSVNNEQKMWKNNGDSMSSVQSMDGGYGGVGGNGGGGFNRDSSMDSRLSGGSTQSDLPRNRRKKKSGLMGKIRNFAKSKGSENETSVQGSDSDVSVASYEHRTSKTNLKERLSDMFKRSGSNIRSSSTESASGPPSNTTKGVLTVRSSSKPPTPVPNITSTTPTPIIKRRTLN